MDTESDYELEIPSTEPSSPGDFFSIESLIQRVEDFQRRDYLATLDELTAENLDLQQRILHYQEEWCSMLDLLQCVHEALLTLQDALGKSFKEQMEAENYWLAFWRIKDDASGGTRYSPAGWI